MEELNLEFSATVPPLTPSASQSDGHFSKRVLCFLLKVQLQEKPNVHCTLQSYRTDHSKNCCREPYCLNAITSTPLMLDFHSLPTQSYQSESMSLST